MSGQLKLSREKVARLLNEMDEFAEKHHLLSFEVEAIIRTGINPDAIISSQDWVEGDPYKVISL